jgi:hypothetical protein
MCFAASAAAPRSLVNSEHFICALAWLQNPTSATIARAGICFRITGVLGSIAAAEVLILSQHCKFN